VTEFQRAVLEVLARSEDALGWYQIERRLSNMALGERSNLLNVLSVLLERGLVDEVAAPTDPRLRHTITPSGRAVLGTPE